MSAPTNKALREEASSLAVDALVRTCEENKLEADEGLKRLFAAAGELLNRRAPGRRSLTSRLMGFAIAEFGRDPPPDMAEADRRVLAVASAFLRRNGERYGAAADEYFYTAAGTNKSTSGKLTLSANVTQLLVHASESGESALVGLQQFLVLYPPLKGHADSLLKALGISRNDYRDAVLKALLPPSKQDQRPNDRVSTHADEPATLDELGRAAFADILAGRIREARESGQTSEPTAFIVHLHGPWGSGKSSILNFLEDNLSRDLRPDSDPWIVVRFNAWRDQRLQPPWWRLITTIYYGARAKLGWRAPWLWLRWLIWRIRADYMPLLSVLIAAAITTFLLWRLGWLTSGDHGKPPDWMDTAKWLVPLGITLLTAIYVNSRSLALGSRRAAQTYADLKDDPFKPIARLFNQLVGAIKRPLVVFIDDLDRCDSKYVVELLEGIQTLMRGAAVTYVVAADRKWICSSFEQRYAGFSPPIGESGRPLGYLFLDKLFQISAAIPQIPLDVQSTYWARLLSSESLDPDRDAKATAAAARQAEQDAAALSRQEDLQGLVEEATESGDRIRIQAVRAACAKRISSPEAVVQTEHRLQAFAHLLEPNPRAMKRLVNAYAMHQATLLLAGQETGPGQLARWTIMELRWPLLADFLAVRCECVDALRHRLKDDEMPQIPETLRCLFGDDLVLQVIGDEEDADRLTTEVVRTVLGAVQGDR